MSHLIYTTLFIAREGDSLDGDGKSKVAADAVPAAKAANWLMIPHLVGCNFPAAPEDGVAHGLAHGRMHITKRFPKGVVDLSFTFKTEHLSALVLESRYQTEKQVMDKPQRPGTRSTLPHFWVKVQRQNEAGQQIDAVNLWGTLGASGDQSDTGTSDSTIEPEYRFGYVFNDKQTQQASNLIYGI